MEAIPLAVREAVKPAPAKSGNEIADMMRHLAPVDSGALKESIAVTLPGNVAPAYSQPGGSRVAGETEVLVTVGDHEVRYAHLVEYGHSNGFGGSIVPPHPFFWPAFRLARKKAENRIKRAIGKAIREKWSRP